MNDIFSGKRFWLLFKKTLLEKQVQLMGLIGLTMLLSLLMYAVLKTAAGMGEAQDFSFVFGLVGGGSFLASFVFNYFYSNASGSSYLTLPASHLEKWLCGVIITGIIFTTLFLLFYRVIDFAFVRAFHNSLNPNDPDYKDTYASVENFPLNGFVAGKSYIMFLNFTGIMLLGSLYFNKSSFIKIALIVSFLYIGGYFLNQVIAKGIFSEVDKALPYYCVFIAVGKDFGKVQLPASASNAVDIGLIYVLPAIFWLTTYVRLREKEF